LEALPECLSKSDRKIFDEMFDIPRSYISACSNSVQYVRLHRNSYVHTTYHFKHLTECISEVEQIKAKVNNSNKKGVDEHFQGSALTIMHCPHINGFSLVLANFSFLPHILQQQRPLLLLYPQEYLAICRCSSNSKPSISNQPSSVFNIHCFFLLSLLHVQESS
jgi:hypothetical protein